MELSTIGETMPSNSEEKARRYENKLAIELYKKALVANDQATLELYRTVYPALKGTFTNLERVRQWALSKTL
jgi:Asp-tRNA(Asn)/Glu-tRNA(Gln) amidotransferase B subunit